MIVFMMLVATLRIMPYEKRQSNMLEATLFGVVRLGSGLGSGLGLLTVDLGFGFR